MRDFRSFSYRVFSLGMAVLIVETFFSLLCMESFILPKDAVSVAQWRMTATAFLPGTWLLFSLSYTRQNYREFLKEWKWTILAAFAIPLCLVFFGRQHLFIESSFASHAMGNWLMPWAGPDTFSL